MFIGAMAEFVTATPLNLARTRTARRTRSTRSLVDPVSAVGAGHSIIDAARTSRARKRGNASNVVLVTDARPRRLDGYRIVCTVFSRSSVGISNVVVQLRMQSGELERDGETSTEAVAFAHHAAAGGDSMELEFPHIVRLGEATFDPQAERGPGYSAILYWCDESGRRRDGGSATSCRPRDFPARP